MAGEKKGDALEALTFLALETLGYKSGQDLFWGEKPAGFSIDPDFIIGSMTEPDCWIMATSTGSAKNTPEKFWRNMGELFEIRRRFSRPPTVLNLVFEAKQMKGLQCAMARISDASLMIETRPYGQVLLDFVDKRLGSLPGERQQKITHLRRLIADAAPVKAVFAAFVKDLKIAVRPRKSELSPLWELLRGEKRQPVERAARRTYVRRGIAKLMVLPADLRRKVYDHVKSGTRLTGLPPYIHSLGIVRKALVARLTDEEVTSVINDLPVDTIEHIIKQSYLARQRHWDQWIQELRGGRTDAYQRYLEDHYAELSTPEGMLRHLNVHAAEGAKWLFWHILEVLKSCSRARQGYGFAALSRDVGYSSGISSGYKHLADWANGTLKSQLPASMLPDVSAALARRLAGLGIKKITAVGAEIEHQTLTNLLEQKLVAYCCFEPLPLLISEALDDHAVPYQWKRKHPTLLGELMATPKFITTPVILANGTLIHWKSAYDKGRHHKTKELAGRAPALRFAYRDGKYVRRSEVSRMVLVLDGTFTQEQISALLRSGWDQVFYPDELDQLIASIR